MFSCRFSLAAGLHPDWMLMLFFAHTHLTVTVTLGLLLVPKVTRRPYKTCRLPFRVGAQLLYCQRGQIYTVFLYESKHF